MGILVFLPSFSYHHSHITFRSISGIRLNPHRREADSPVFINSSKPEGFPAPGIHIWPRRSHRPPGKTSVPEQDNSAPMRLMAFPCRPPVHAEFSTGIHLMVAAYGIGRLLPCLFHREGSFCPPQKNSPFTDPSW